MTKPAIEMRPAAMGMLACLILFMLLPTVLIGVGTKEHRIHYHLRPLVPFPQTETLLQDPKTYFKDIEGWHQDRVGFAVLSGRTRRRILFEVFNDDTVPRIVRGPKDMVFLGGHGEEHTVRSIHRSCPELDAWPDLSDQVVKDWRAIEMAFQAHGIAPRLLIYPSKKTLYPEYLPTRLPLEIRTRCEQMRAPGHPLEALANTFPHSVRDAYKDLAPHKHRSHFYPPENFHADGEAAMLGVHGAIRLMRPDTALDMTEPMVLRRDLSDLSGIVGFHYSILLRVPEAFDPAARSIDAAYEDRVRAALDTDKYVKRYTHPAATFDERVLLITNSFGIRAAPYFARHFSDVEIISTNGLKTFEDHTRMYETFVFQDPPDHVVLILHDESVFEQRLRKYAASLPSETNH